jgi:hypothetical protein
MLKTAVLLGFCFALPSLASPIVRSASITLPSFGTFQVEMSVESQSIGRITNVQAILRSQDTADDGLSTCSTSTHLTGPNLTYTLKNSVGSVIATVSQVTELENLEQTSVNLDGSCSARSILSSATHFFHADQFADFTITNPTGETAKLSLSTFFNGDLNVTNDGSDQATVATNSLLSLRYFFNNQGGGTSQLTDPSAPPAPAYDPANDIDN